MAKGNVEFTKDNEYYTPKAFLDRFGKFEYDPATTKEKAAEFGLKNFDTAETDGLAADWTKYKKIWINPPFTIKHKFFEKAVKTCQETGAEIYMLFPIEFLTTKRFHEALGEYGGVIYLPDGRIKFESGLNKKATAPAFGSVVMKITNDKQITIKRVKL